MLSNRSQQSYAAQRQQQLHLQQQAAGPGSRTPGGGGRSTSPGPMGSATPDRLLTDRSSYITYLESQLERVSAACLSVASYEERLEGLVSAVRLLEERSLNVARLVNCTQQYAEQQESVQKEGLQAMSRRLASLEAKLEQLVGPQAQLEVKLEAVGPAMDAKLKAFADSSERQLVTLAEGLEQGLDAKCHEAHIGLCERAAEASGRIAELERKLRAVDEYAHECNSQAQVASLTSRVGSMEDSLGHLSQANAGVKQMLTTVEQAVGQLRTAVVALELRPPVEGTEVDTLQWLDRAREALKAEIQGMLAQSQQLAEGIQTAQQTAEGQPSSPQKAVATQVLSGMQGALHSEVGRELQALQVADNFIATVASQLARSPRPSQQQQQQPAQLLSPAMPPGRQLVPASDGTTASVMPGTAALGPLQQQQPQWGLPVAMPAAHPTCGLAGAPCGTTMQQPAAWSIPAVHPAAAIPAVAPPAATRALQAAASLPPAGHETATGACHTLLRVPSDPAQPLQQLPGTQPSSPCWGAHPCAGPQWSSCSPPASQVPASWHDPGGQAADSGGGLRGSLGQMQGMLQSVSDMLQGGTTGKTLPSSRSLSLGLQRTSFQQKRAWCPGGPVAGTSNALLAAGRGGAGLNRSAVALPSSSKQAQRAMEERRKRLQQLYAELRGS